MPIARRIARPMLAAMFVSGGLDSLRNPTPKVPVAEPVALPLADKLPINLPQDPEQLVKINGAVQLIGGLMLATGRLPRLASLALASSIIPTTAAGHRFWEQDDPGLRANHQIHFLKNVGLLGGLLLAAVDTEGKPSVRWRAQHAAGHARGAVGSAVGSARDALPVG